MSLNEEKSDSLQEKRRLLSYWKSLESPTTSDQEKDEIDKDDLVEELERSLAEMDQCISHVVNVEKETKDLQSEQLSLLKHFGEYVQQFIKEKSVLDINDNSKTEEDKDYQQLRFDALKAEKTSVLKENERLAKQLKTQSEEYESSSREQQRDIEKLTRVCVLFLQYLPVHPAFPCPPGLSPCLSTGPYARSFFLSVCLFVYLSVWRLSVWRLSVSLSVRLSVRPPVRPPACPSARLSVRPPACPSVCLSLRLSVVTCLLLRTDSLCKTSTIILLII